MAIIVDKLNYVYSDAGHQVQALQDISVVIPDGQFLGIIGHTGSGKSTFIQHLNGLLKASSGNIYYNGEDICHKDYDRKQLRSKVGLVFQYPEHQLFEADVFQDVCFGPKNLGLDRKQTELRAFTALRQVGVPEDLFYVSPFELSGGQKRRVAIAGVLAMEPEVLILDEPTAGLDPKGRDDLLDQLAKLHKERNMTIILVSHSMEDVARLTDRLLVMNGSRLAMDAAPESVFTHAEELVEMGLNIPQVTQVFLRLREMGVPVNNVYTIDQAVAEIKRVKGGAVHA